MSRLVFNNHRPVGGSTDAPMSALPKARSTTTFPSGTPVLEESVNVSSLTDTANGRLTINLTNAFSAAVGPGIVSTNGPQDSGFGHHRGFHSTAWMIDASTIAQSGYSGTNDADPEVETAVGMGVLA